MAFAPATLYAVNIATAESVDLLIDQISDFNVDTGITEMLLGADGNVDNTFVAVGSQNPVISMTSSAIATILASCGIGGLKISSDVDDDGMECFFQAITEGGTRAGASSHLKLTINEGMLLPRTITAAHNEPATMTLDAIISYDGTNEPIVIETGQSLEGTASVGEVYTGAKATINGTDLDGIQETTIDFGLTEMVLGADGSVWPTFVAVGSRAPVITLRTLDNVALNTFGLDGTAQGATDSLVYLQHMAEGGTRVAAATETHISFSIDEGIITCRTVGGTHNEPLMTEVQITPTWDGTAAVMVIDTTAPIA